MRPDEISKHLRAEPFHPIRIFLSDGSSYPVLHPELMMVTRSMVVIAVGGNGDLPETTTFCDPVHITRIQPISTPRRRGRK